MTRRFIARFVSHQAKRSSLLSDEGIARYSYSFSANRLKNVGATSEAQRLASLRALSVRAVSSDVGGQAGVEKALLRPKYPAFLPSFLHTPVGTPATFNRYALIPAAITNHLSLGSIFAWSVFNQPLTTVDGVVAASAADWSLGDTSLTFSLVMGGFAWGGLFGNFLKHLGPRACGVIGATTLGTGYLMAAAAIQTHNLPLLYGAGLVWGIANGFSYVPPVANLLRWFPERKGFASSACIVGYGLGAAIASPLFSKLLLSNRELPVYLGPEDAVSLINKDGRLYVDMMANRAGRGGNDDLPNGVSEAEEIISSSSSLPDACSMESIDNLREVVVAASGDLQALLGNAAAEASAAVGGPGSPGVYLLDSGGSTGLAETFAIAGSLYACAMTLSAFMYKVPSLSSTEDDKVPLLSPATDDTTSDQRAISSSSADAKLSSSTCAAPTLSSSLSSSHQVDPPEVSPPVAMRSSQFWLMYMGFVSAAIGTYGVISTGKTLLSDCFATAMPDIVTPAFCAWFVTAMSLSNTGGRLFYPNLSDVIQRRRGVTIDPLYARRLVYSVMWGLGPPAYLAMLWACHNATSGSIIPLVAFSGAVFTILASFGGSAATRPAMMSDAFGTHNLEVLTARQMSCVLPAALAGPRLVAYFRDSASREAITHMVGVSPTQLQETGAESATRQSLDPLPFSDWLSGVGKLPDYGQGVIGDETFEHVFGASRTPETVAQLIDTKTLTIARLMDVVPVDTVDPTPYLYDQMFICMACLQAIGFAMNAAVRPIGGADRHSAKEDVEAEAK